MNPRDEKTIVSSTPDLDFHFGLFKVRDYRIPYGLVGMHIFGTHKSIFPRSGDLVLNLYMGNSFKNRIVNYDNTWATTNKLYISGLFSEGALELEQRGKCLGYAIKIHPVIGYYILHIPMCEIVDKQVRISDVLESKGHLLMNVETSEKIDSLNSKSLRQFFTSILPEKSEYIKDPIYHAVNFIKNRNGCVGIRELSSRFCMSERTLNRNFLLKVGLSAQAYSKIWQIEHAVRLIQRYPQASLNEIAFKAGYYDTAHLSRAFREKANLPPSSFRKDTNVLTENYLLTERFSI
ncbi:helix-turn-helix domain-containing protein [uncultured Kriegella sp.]|uniref:helix-turn-helix domain-containing protein n=1 Tax=uncultured Kriegella sp. TaxID=1798910 RepID=UPI0030D77CB9|tara:strand:+ start:115083 stop:115958 length:876 start_codon:yes stop_codon:yes gene_type:complete